MGAYALYHGSLIRGTDSLSPFSVIEATSIAPIEIEG